MNQKSSLRKILQFVSQALTANTERAKPVWVSRVASVKLAAKNNGKINSLMT
jgi:hypothetical protein